MNSSETATASGPRLCPWRSEHGFTLIELLVVILIIGVLAAIALPSFMSQQGKGQDASAKSNARNLVTFVESCFADSQSYANCTTSSQLGGTSGVTGLILVTGPPLTGQVAVTAATQYTYTVQARSPSTNLFSITRTATGALTRDCSPRGQGGCRGAPDAQGNYW